MKERNDVRNRNRNDPRASEAFLSGSSGIRVPFRQCHKIADRFRFKCHFMAPRNRSVSHVAFGSEAIVELVFLTVSSPRCSSTVSQTGRKSLISPGRCCDFHELPKCDASLRNGNNCHSPYAPGVLR